MRMPTSTLARALVIVLALGATDAQACTRSCLGEAVTTWAGAKRVTAAFAGLFVKTPPRVVARTPKLRQADVALAAQRFLDAKGVDMTGVRIREPEFRPNTGSWLIHYSRDTLELGGSFGVFIADDDISRIRLRGSR
jgi:hypothetical protein